MMDPYHVAQMRILQGRAEELIAGFAEQLPGLPDRMEPRYVSSYQDHSEADSDEQDSSHNSVSSRHSSASLSTSSSCFAPWVKGCPKKMPTRSSRRTSTY